MGTHWGNRGHLKGVIPKCQVTVPWFDLGIIHDDVIKWKHFPCYWPFARGIHRSSVNSPQKGQWRGALVFSLICAWRNGWANNGDTGDLRRHRTHYHVTVMFMVILPQGMCNLRKFNERGSLCYCSRMVVNKICLNVVGIMSCDNKPHTTLNQFVSLSHCSYLMRYVY